MKGLPSGKKVTPRGSVETEDSSDSDEDLEKLNKTKKKELPYRYVPTMKPVVEVPPVPAKYRLQDKQKDTREKVSTEVPKQNYRHQAPVEKEVDVEQVVDRNLNEKVPITHEELLALSPKYRAAYKERMTKKRVATSLQSVIANALEEVSDPEEEQERVPTVQVNMNQLAEGELVQRQVFKLEGPPEQSWVMQDPALQYLETLPQEERKHQVFVARESETLRVVTAMINGVRNEEALLDNGSQIISMSSDVAIACQLSWDPDTTINMQSANGQVQRTCGLAKDVPFTVGGITVYLQVHVMDNPAYRVLLGRPFDALTESQVNNLASGGQILVIKDPNTKRRAVLPTYARGESPIILNRSQKLGVNF